MLVLESVVLISMLSLFSHCHYFCHMLTEQEALTCLGADRLAPPEWTPGGRQHCGTPSLAGAQWLAHFPDTCSINHTFNMLPEVGPGSLTTLPVRGLVMHRCGPNT